MLSQCDDHGVTATAAHSFDTLMAREEVLVLQNREPPEPFEHKPMPRLITADHGLAARLQGPTPA